MRTTVGIATEVVLILIAAAVILGSRVLASSDSDRAEIVALNRQQFDAFNKKDPDKVMSFYVDDKDTVFFEDTTPFQLQGTSALRKYDQQFFESASRIQSGFEAISIVVSGELAAAHYTLSIRIEERIESERLMAVLSAMPTQVGEKMSGIGCGENCGRDPDRQQRQRRSSAAATAMPTGAVRKPPRCA